jgi:hypothetical protein
MLRCVAAVVFVAVVAAQAAVVPPAAAQAMRNFPANALRGEVAFAQPPELLLNGQPMRLAPGARIRGSNNMQLLSGALVGQRAVVHFTLDPQGQLLDLWLLTPEELAKRPWPSTPAQAATWQFDAIAQSWSRP